MNLRRLAGAGAIAFAGHSLSNSVDDTALGEAAPLQARVQLSQATPCRP
jgi:hypothetical protein